MVFEFPVVNMYLKFPINRAFRSVGFPQFLVAGIWLVAFRKCEMYFGVFKV